MKHAVVIFLNLTLLLALPGLVTAQQTSPQQSNNPQNPVPGMPQGQPQAQPQGQQQGRAQSQAQSQGQMQGQRAQPMAGSGLMTPEEREELRERVRSAGSQEERQAIMDDHRLKMADRARAQGMNPESIEGLPSASGDDPRARRIQGQPTGASQGGGGGPAASPGQGAGMNTGPASGAGRGAQQPVPGQQNPAGSVR